MPLRYQSDMENVDVDAAIKVVNDILDLIAANPTLEFGPEGMPEDVRILLMTLEELPTPPTGNPITPTANHPLSTQEVPSVALSEAFVRGHKPSTSITPPPESWNEPQVKQGNVSQHPTDRYRNEASDEASIRTDNERTTGIQDQRLDQSLLYHPPTDANYVAWATQQPATLSNSYQGSPYKCSNESVMSDGKYMKGMTYLSSHGGEDLHPRFYAIGPNRAWPAAPDLMLMQQSVCERPQGIPIAVSNRMHVGKSRDAKGGSGLPYRTSLNSGDDKDSNPSLLMPSGSEPSWPNAAISLFGGLQHNGGYNNTARDNRTQVRTTGPPASIRDRAFLAPSGDSSLISLSSPTYYPPSSLSSVHISSTRVPFGTAHHVNVQLAHGPQESQIGPKRRSKKERKTKAGNAFGSGTGIRCRLPNCNVPDYEFASRKELERHQGSAAVHCGTRARCPKCEKAYSREDVVLRHIKRSHPSIDVGA
ncbi:hypothetical protein A7U60_g3533 [Sanghuangporus baumii]|uniref:C2H2-type domain-containing protein n=1 Tax=Sanghuangporus baumii TaxID=108892 RepID=A0A9Q5I136_SANBA|nr:hypothetical protein A7U60_g3533 [Sanghuangporus baumii]